MDKKALIDHIEARIEEAKFYVAAYNAVCNAAKTFDGKVLNKRIDPLITKNIQSLGYPSAIGRFVKDYSMKFKVYSRAFPYRETTLYINDTDLTNNRFNFSVWESHQGPKANEEYLESLFKALKNIDTILTKHTETLKAVKDYSTFLALFGLNSYSDLFRIN